MIFGELVPKTLALQYPTQTALFTVLPMLWSLRVYRLVHRPPRTAAACCCCGCCGVPPGHRHVHSPEEIELLIAESRDGGLLEPQEQVRLHRALRLGLRNARAADGAARAARGASKSTRRSPDVLRIVATSPYSRLPVYRGSLDDIVGILHTKDVVTRLRRARPRRTLAPDPADPARAETMPADRLLAFLRERRSHQALVVDVGGTSSA